MNSKTLLSIEYMCFMNDAACCTCFIGNVFVPAGGEGAVNGGSLGLGNGIEWIAITVANHHMDGKQLVVSRTVTCQGRPSSAVKRGCLNIHCSFNSILLLC